MTILIIDNENDVCSILKKNKIFGDEYIVNTVNSVAEGYKSLKNQSIDLVFFNVNLPGPKEFDLLSVIKNHQSKCELVLICDNKDKKHLSAAMTMGILDIITQPIEPSDIMNCIENFERASFFLNKINVKEYSKLLSLPDEALIDFNDYPVEQYFKLQIGIYPILSEKMQLLYNKLAKLKNFKNMPVLLKGPTGVGKEIVAKYLHHQDTNNLHPFVGVNCPSISKELFESELFGYEKGSFTGANPKGAPGLIEAANKGTLFLDEISEIPMQVQAKLLRLIQENEFYKVGSSKKQNVNCRFVFASNKDIPELIKHGLFREDLYYRINMFSDEIPPLKERNLEIIPIALYFINIINKELQHKYFKAEVGFFKELLKYDWPGNIRELKNIVNNIAIFNDQEIITRKILSELIRNKKVSKETLKTPDVSLEIKNHKPVLKEPPRNSVEDFQIPEHPFDINNFIKKIITQTLEKFNGNKTKTAQFLNLKRSQLYKRFKTDKKP